LEERLCTSETWKNREGRSNKKIPNVVKISKNCNCYLNFQSVKIPMKIFLKFSRISSVTVGSEKAPPIHLPTIYFISDYIFICILQALLIFGKSQTLKESYVVFALSHKNSISRYSK
jgi:hypothetical protein